MSAEIITTSNFRKEAKRLLKKYHSLRGELEELSELLAEKLRDKPIINHTHLY